MRNRNPLRTSSVLSLVLVPTLLLAAAAPWGDEDEEELELDISRIYWEFNDSANDLGVHVFLDGEDWKSMKISNPEDRVIFRVRGKGPYAELGLTELFFEGAEPSLDEFPLEELLERFPEGEYEFEGRTTDGAEIEGEGVLSHAIPEGPEVFTRQGRDGFLEISWNHVTSTPPGFPCHDVNVVAYQVIVEPSYQVTVPASVLSVTVTPEFVQTLPAGENKFEVLAIEESGNQSITEGTFVR